MKQAAQPLSAGQQRVFDVLCEFFRKRRRAPTFRELAGLLGISSPNGVECLTERCQRRGLRLRSELMRIRLPTAAGSATP